jgi:hypothetical protein
MKTKNIFLGLILFVTAGLFVACSKDDTTPVLTNITVSTLDALPVTDFILTKPAGGENPSVVTITWTETVFKTSENLPVGPVSYTLEADKSGNNFSNPVALAASRDLYANLMAKDVNKILIDNFAAVPEQAISIELRVKTTFGEATLGTVIAANTAYSSNTLTLTLTPFEPAADIVPVYFIGNMQGWDNGGTQFPMYRDDNDPSNGVFTYTGLFAANTYFKMCSQENLGGWDKMYYKGEDGKLLIGNSDPAFFIENEGYYTVTIDVNAMTWKLEPYDVSAATAWNEMSFVGKYCNWGDETGDVSPLMTKVMTKGDGTPEIADAHNWKWEGNLNDIEFGVKFRANHSWDSRWCPKVPKDNPYGVAEFNQSADNNIDISEQGDYQVWFNDLTGHYIVKHK